MRDHTRGQLKCSENEMQHSTRETLPEVSQKERSLHGGSVAQLRVHRKPPISFYSKAMCV
jgi:hypothetical protein